MRNPLPEASLNQLFTEARTHNVLGGSVDDATLVRLYDLFKMGPTAANASPARVVFVKSDEAKERLIPLMMESNAEKVRQAPVTAIVGHDMKFYDRLPELFPHADVRGWYAGKGKEAYAAETAFRNGTLQAAYLILAARALGLDTGPMSGFDAEGVDREFFAGTDIKSNLLINIGYGDDSALFPRSPRLSFEDAVKVI